MSLVKNILLLAVCLLLSGCFPGRSVIVLLPDEDGKVGEVHVESGNKMVVVDEAYHSVTTTASFFEPKSPETITKDEVEATFEAAIAKEPRQRFRFEKKTFYFLHNSVKMTPSSKAMLPEMTESLRSKQPSSIYVVGHADRAGTEYYNRHLSLQRAEMMRQTLIDGGIVTPIITISYLGESMPAVMTPDEVPEAKNRRA
ncbi:MAG TPA: OmpA family protein, partial [Desulfopila sp.]|nr:OmpA family protein [Desulfopila sp.]